MCTHTCTHTHTQEEHYNTLVYQLPPTGLQLSKVFELMEVARESLDSLEDYSVSQTTLDDVFIHFANQQREDAGIMRGEERRRRRRRWWRRAGREELEEEEEEGGASVSVQLPDVVAETNDPDVVSRKCAVSSVAIS